MKSCMQTEKQNTLQHGLSVWRHTRQLLTGDTSGFRLPQWYVNYKDRILENIHPYKTIKHYNIWHDCGKFACLTIDENGKRHFPNHAEKSKEIFLEHISSDQTIARLIGLDMIMHTESYEQIMERNLDIKNICTLLITALAELHSNAKMFGGIESDSFKIKWKRLEKLGKKLCFQYFDHGYVYVVTRNDLTPAQKAVQSCHASIEVAREYIKPNQEHPSLVLCLVKNEAKLKNVISELYEKNIKIKTFREPDMDDQITAIATEPLYGAERKALARFQLLT